MNELRFDHGQGSWPYLIPVEIRPTRTLSKPDGICSSGVGQHQVNARHANLPYNALLVDVGWGVVPKSSWGKLSELIPVDGLCGKSPPAGVRRPTP